MGAFSRRACAYICSVLRQAGDMAGWPLHEQAGDVALRFALRALNVPDQLARQASSVAILTMAWPHICFPESFDVSSAPHVYARGYFDEDAVHGFDLGPDEPPTEALDLLLLVGRQL